MRISANKNGFVSMLGLLITVAIIGTLMYYLINAYLNTDKIDEQTNGQIKEAGIDTSSYVGILESSKKQIHEAEQRNLKRADEVLDQMKGKY